MSTSQKDGVFNAIEAHLAECDPPRTIPDSEPLKLETDDRKSVVEMLCAATTAGELTVKAISKIPYADIPADKLPAELKSYWDGTLSNWLRKDTRLNGGSKYEAKNPGSRQGSTDGRLKNLKLLAKKVEATEDSETKAANMKAVNEAIEARTKEIAVEKAAKLEVNAELIPDELKHLLTPPTTDDETAEAEGIVGHGEAQDDDEGMDDDEDDSIEI